MIDKVKKAKNGSQSGKQAVVVAEAVDKAVATLPSKEETAAKVQELVNKGIDEVIVTQVAEETGMPKEKVRELMEMEQAELEVASTAPTKMEEFMDREEICIANLDSDFCVDLGAGQFEPVTSLHRDPTFFYKGSKVTLTPSERGPSEFGLNLGYYRRNNTSIINYHHDVAISRYAQSDEPKDFKAKWWTANVNNVTFWLTQGSSLNVREHIGREGWDYDEEPSPGEKHIVVLIASGITCSHLSASGFNVFNNSSLISGNYVDICRSRIVTSTVDSKYNVNIRKSVINASRFYDSEYLNVKDSDLANVSISSYQRVNFIKTRTGGNRGGRFSITNWRGGDTQAPILSVGDIILPEFDVMLGAGADTFKHYLSDESLRSRSIVMNIRNRIDFGHFSGIEPLPFIRINDHDMLVGGEVFTAKEFFGGAPQDTQLKPTDPTGMGSLPRDPTPYYGSGIGIVGLGMGGHYKGSLLWNRAAKALYGYKYRQMVIGKNGENLVNALVEQIKSRLGLYVEIQNMGL